jgi:hypothetical protein
MYRGCLKSKRIPSIFNDESTGSFICLRQHIYMSHVNTTCFVTGSTVLYRITPQSGIDHDFVSVVKILLKASPHSFLQQATPHIRLRNVFQGQRCEKNSGTSSDVIILRFGAQGHTIIKYRHLNVKMKIHGNTTDSEITKCTQETPVVKTQLYYIL